ncbi:formate dehydrogenase accessory sulfurtransferase FdhD [Sphingosinicella sp. CPCC 101087]|uniref:formate dehydrogenase accessory sulfurtransferase FdhD n=1 Tax=Sphingosinicella sp. CPCC 101087 TaxID=2497754 RepID=UPI001FB16EB3|nr:formate dehydrogenase accessory sulfurtransferase FdhD [Sphingosinicella sp. CPCC 101087]
MIMKDNMQQRIQFVTTLRACRVGADGSRSVGERKVPAEVPVAVSFLGIGYAVMMATPHDLEDFAYGFARSERLIESAADVVGVDVREADDGMLLGIELAPERHGRVLQRVRHRVGESSCGLCGIENLEQALRPLPQVPAPDRGVAPSAIFRALEAIRAHQPLNEATGAVHAAALCDAGGAVLAAREDVGRHNAFDKLIGHCLREGRDLSAGFALLTARCSYELVEKAALAGIPMLVTISAPTSLAVARAAESGLTLAALARSDSLLAMSDPHGLFAT